MSETLEAVKDVIAEIICESGDDPRESGKKILSYADGGIEYIWEEYLAQRIIDIPRIYQEISDEWKIMGKTLIEGLKARADNRL